MNRLMSPALISLLLWAAWPGPVRAQPAAQTGVPAQGLQWLSGCWAVEGAEAGNTEQWMAPVGGALLGMARTVRGGRMVGFEFMRIAPAADGVLSFYAQPSGKPASAFAVLAQSEAAVSFENLAHDFPQRVLYRRVSARALHARIEGVVNGTDQHLDFPMQRVDCDLAAPLG